MAATEQYRSLSLLVHGASKTGKTWLGDTSPAPRLIFDAEGGNRFTPSSKIVWDPATEQPPAYDGTWDSCIVYVREYGNLQAAYQWLAAGQHPFKSVVMDSVSEVQQRCVDSIAGVGQMDQRMWGDLLRHMSDLVRKFRDLTIHPTNPLEAVVLIAMTREFNGRHAPYVQGQLATTLPYYIDVTGYFYTEPDPDDPGHLRRRMLVSPHPQFEAGDRTGRLGVVVEDPHVGRMLDTIFGVRTDEAPVEQSKSSGRTRQSEPSATTQE